MISFSIWHCDYCLGDICCCIKSNLPFLSSIVSTRELLSFFKVGGDNLTKHPSKEARSAFSTACPPATLLYTPPMVFALCKTSRLTDCPLLQWGRKLITVRAFACTDCGPSLYCSGAANSSHSHGSTLLIVLVTPGHRNQLNSLQLGLCSC